MNRVNRSEIDRALWVAFAALFLGMVATTWLPVEPIVWGLPFWTVIALATMLASVVVAGVAGWYYQWPSEGAGEAR